MPQLSSPAPIQAHADQRSCLTHKALHSVTPQYRLLPPSHMTQGAHSLVRLPSLLPQEHALVIHLFVHHSFMTHILSTTLPGSEPGSADTRADKTQSCPRGASRPVQWSPCLFCRGTNDGSRWRVGQRPGTPSPSSPLKSRAEASEKWARAVLFKRTLEKQFSVT